MIRHALALIFAAARLRAQGTYALKPTPKSVVWGYYDAKATPAARLTS